MRYLLPCLLLSLIACGTEQPPATTATPSATTPTSGKTPVYQRFSNENFATLRVAYPSAPLIDVRTPEEYAAGHIPGAKNINVNDPDFREQIGNYNKQYPIFVYCQAGGRSAKACGALEELGFEQIYELKNGYGEWE